MVVFFFFLTIVSQDYGLVIFFSAVSIETSYYLVRGCLKKKEIEETQ